MIQLPNCPVVRRSSVVLVVAAELGVQGFLLLAVLWAQSNYDAAIRLEELWNELAQEYSFHLCCAYPASAFREPLTRDLYQEICAQHSQVVSAF